MRRQIVKCGINPAGSSRALRLDPLSLPVSFHAHDARADGFVRQVELDRDRVVLRRAVRGMHMALRLRVSDFLGIALRGAGDEEVLVLAHRDPSLTIPLCVNIDHDEIVTAWETWSGILGLPKLQDRRQEPAQRRRRRNAIRARRPKFLVRRRVGGLLNPTNSFRGEREIIARD